MQAAQLPRGSIDRLLLVAAFAQSGFAAGLRPYKCLNPVAGETFEVCLPVTMRQFLDNKMSTWNSN